LSTTTQPDTEAQVSGSQAASRPYAFVTTHWSVVLNAGREQTPQAQDALEKLCQTYWRPLYAYVRRRGYSPDDAADLTQGFFARLLERRWLERADEKRGRFRSFLLATLSNFIANEWDKATTQKRGGGRILSLQRDVAESDGGSEPADRLTPEQIFEWRWALALLDQVMNRLSDEFAQNGKTELFEAIKPCLLGERNVQPYAALASRMGMTEGSVKVTVHRLRQRYRQLLRDEIAHTVATPEEVEEEMRYLFAVLARR